MNAIERKIKRLEKLIERENPAFVRLINGYKKEIKKLKREIKRKEKGKNNGWH